MAPTEYFRGSTSMGSTFIVKKNSYFWRIMSLGEQADADFRANAFARASVRDRGQRQPRRRALDPAQLDALVWLYA